MNETSNNTDNAFLDVAANTLAVIMIVCLFAFFVVERHQERSQEPIQDTEVDTPFQEPLWSAFPPWNRYYIVDNGNIRLWNLDAFAEDYAARPPASRRGKTKTPHGTYQVKTLPIVLRDLDTYYLDFWPQRDPAVPSRPLSDAEPYDALLASLVQAFDENRLVPTFFVYPKGMDIFDGLYSRLTKASARFRWIALKDSEPIRLYRQHSMFRDYRFRR